MWHTKLTEQMDIEFPIIQAPMAGEATTPDLVAAVSNTGGLGSFAAGYLSPEEIRQQIRKIRDLTNKPFSVNLFIPQKHHANPEQINQSCKDIENSCVDLNIKIPPIIGPYAQPFEEQISILIEEKIPIFSYTFGTLDSKWVSQFKKNQTLLLGTATTLAEARALEQNGVDFIVAQGSEAGGHRGTFLSKEEDALIGLFSLIPQLVDEMKIPIIAAGGIMDGRGIVAAIKLGAVGVQLGTAFLSCLESGIPQRYKQTLLTQQQDNTVLTRSFSGKLARGIGNTFIEQMNKNSAHILDYPIQNALTNIMRKKAKEAGNINYMSLFAGQSATLCRALSASELMNSLIIETQAALIDRTNC